MEAGTTVFLANGTEVTYVGPMPGREGRHVVSVPVYGGPDNDEIVDYETREVSVIHAAEPKYKRNAEIARLDAEIAKKQKELRELEQQSQKSAKLVAEIASYRALERLEAFMAGRFTHVVRGRKLDRRAQVEHIDVVPFEESCQSNSWGGEGKGIALMCLFGQSDGNLAWQINEYKDGSGSWSVIIPCLSFDEAKQKAGELILTGLSTITTDYSRLCDLLKSAETLELAVPEKYIDARTHEERRRGLEKIASLEKELAATREKLGQ